MTVAVSSSVGFPRRNRGMVVGDIGARLVDSCPGPPKDVRKIE